MKRYLVVEKETVRRVAVYAVLAENKQEAIGALMEGRAGACKYNDQEVQRTSYKVVPEPDDAKEADRLADELGWKALSA